MGTKDHLTVTDEEGHCLYCGFAAVKRDVKEKDVRDHAKHEIELERKKFEALEIYVKDLRYEDKVN
jgi:hypothetical protein